MEMGGQEDGACQYPGQGALQRLVTDTISERPVPFGTDVCFDDWCATIEGMDTVKALGNAPNKIHANGVFVILHVKMSNHTLGIAQKPSEPRIHIADGRGHFWPFSVDGQRALESIEGKQKDIGDRLELRESLETRIVLMSQ
jgi:hypothetical protein